MKGRGGVCLLVEMRCKSVTPAVWSQVPGGAGEGAGGQAEGREGGGRGE